MKRARSSMSRDANVRKAIAISSRIRSKYPYSSYGRAYYKRGSSESLANFGPSYKAANEAQRAQRRALGFVGQGLYMGGKGGYWGRKIGGWFGAPELGDKLGDLGAAAIRSLVPGGGLAMDAAKMAANVMQGKGAYVNNSLVAGNEPIPVFAATPDGSTVKVTHREYIGDVFAPPTTQPFANAVYAVNPGIERTFPWLSQLAQNYDEYTIHQLMFTFRSTVADFAASSGQIGQVIMATQYNASVEPFSDKAAMMQYDGSMSCKTSENMVHGVECDPAKLSGSVGRYTRTNPVLVGQDINQYDHGQFNIAITETPATYANQSMGELWVSYTVELRKPKFFTNRGLGINRDVFLSIGNSVPVTGLFSPTAGASYYAGQQNNIGCSLVARNSSSTIAPGLECVSVDDAGNFAGPSVGTESNVFQITFPANVSGNFRVILRVGEGTAYAPAAASNWYVFRSGNIEAFVDQGIVDSTSVRRWYNGGQSFGIGKNTWMVYFDLRVEPATGGIDNTIFFTRTGGIPTHDVAQLEICEMNYGLSYKLDGTKDQLILVDSAGTVQVPIS